MVLSSSLFTFVFATGFEMKTVGFVWPVYGRVAVAVMFGLVLDSSGVRTP